MHCPPYLRDGRDEQILRSRQVASMLNAFKPGDLVRVNLAGMQFGGVSFQSAVTHAVGNIVKQISNEPPKYLVKLTFSFRGITEVEVPQDRLRGG